MPKKRKRKLLRYIIALVALLALVTMSLYALQVIGDRTVSPFGVRNPEIIVNELEFDIGRSRTFVSSEVSVAAAGTFGVQVLGFDGVETLRDTFRMHTPAIIENSGIFLAFDIGGTSIRRFNSNQMLNSIETAGKIVSATINSNGWFTVVSQEPGIFRGTVIVYNNQGRPVYKIELGTGFPVKAELSKNNQNLAILSLTNSGSQVSFYIGIAEDKEEPDHIFFLPDTVIFDIAILNNDDIIAISTQSVLRISGIGEGVELYNFSSMRLGGFSHGNGFIALNLYDYGVGHTGKIVTVDIRSGATLGEQRVYAQVIAMSANYERLVILQADEVIFFDVDLIDAHLSEESHLARASGGILLLGESIALTTSDSSAQLVRG